MKNLFNSLNEELYINITYAEYTVLTDWCTISPSIYNDNALYYITKGCAEIIINNKQYFLKAGDICIIPAGAEACYRQISDSFEKYFVHFDLNISKIPVFNILEFEYVINFNIKKSIITRLESLIHCMTQRGYYNTFECFSYLFEILTVFFENNKYNWIIMKKVDYKANKALGYIIEKFKGDIHIDEVAEFVEVHPKYLSRVFKDKFKQSVNQLVNSKKIDFVFTIMMHNDVTMKEAMALVNYYDYKSVNNWFHTIKEIEPRKYLTNVTRFLNSDIKLPVGYYLSNGKCCYKKLSANSKIDITVKTDTLLCIKNGKLNVISEEKNTVVNEKEVFLIKENSKAIITSDADCTYYTLSINLNKDNIIKIGFENAFYVEVEDLLRNLIEICKTGLTDIPQYFKYYTYLSGFLSMVFESEKDNCVRNFSSVVKYIENSLSEDLTVPFIASEFNISQKSLVSLFKKNTGQNPSMFISDLKYKKALDYIKNTKIPLYDVSCLLGFRSYEGFRKFIKRKSGDFPGKLRNNT